MVVFQVSIVKPKFILSSIALKMEIKKQLMFYFYCTFRNSGQKHISSILIVYTENGGGPDTYSGGCRLNINITVSLRKYSAST